MCTEIVLRLMQRMEHFRSSTEAFCHLLLHNMFLTTYVQQIWHITMLVYPDSAVQCWQCLETKGMPLLLIVVHGRAVRTRVQEHWYMAQQFMNHVWLRCVNWIPMMSHVLCAVECPAQQVSLDCRLVHATRLDCKNQHKATYNGIVYQLSLKSYLHSVLVYRRT